MDRRSVLKGMGAAAATMSVAGSPSWAAGAAKRPPNVLFILPDEWRAQSLGCMGNPDVKTPHLDQLASEGVLMRNTFSNTPVCTPARGILLTGTYASTNGAINNDLRLPVSKVTLANLFDQAGYRTGYIGKWHLDGGERMPGFIPPERRHGFQYWAANECNHNYFHNEYFVNTDTPILTDEYMPYIWTQRAVDFLREKKDQPFFLMLSYGAPHDPYTPPKKYLDMYDSAKLTMEPNWVPGVKGGSREDIAGYYGAITALDDQIHLLTKTLEDIGQADNTILIFSSDHGNMLGSQGKILKQKPWEESIRVPGIIRCPALIPSGRKIDELVAHVDFAPTLLSLCGLPVPSDMQGTDQSRVIAGKSGKGSDAAYFQIFIGSENPNNSPHAWRAIRTQRYMYARFESGGWLLYDLQKDPYELHNLINDSSTAAVRKDLDERLLAWMKRIGDSWNIEAKPPRLQQQNIHED